VSLYCLSTAVLTRSRAESCTSQMATTRTSACRINCLMLPPPCGPTPMPAMVMRSLGGGRAVGSQGGSRHNGGKPQDARRAAESFLQELAPWRPIEDLLVFMSVKASLLLSDPGSEGDPAGELDHTRHIALPLIVPKADDVVLVLGLEKLTQLKTLIASPCNVSVKFSRSLKFRRRLTFCCKPLDAKPVCQRPRRRSRK